MSDNFQLQWKITTMDCYPNFSGEKDYVFNVHWDCLTYYSGISGGPFYGRSYSVTAVPINTGSYTPYDDLEPSQVLEWVWGKMGPKDKAQAELASANQIYTQLNPPVVQPPIPWTQPVFPVIAPFIINQPVSGLILPSGYNGSISVNVGGQPLNYTWHKDGADISGANGANYMFNNIQPEQSGVYDVFIYNTLGNVQSSGCLVEVTSPYAPSIFEQPTDASGYLNNPVTLNVSASGYPAPVYKWNKDGTEISGSNYSNFSFSVTDETTGVYNAVASNYLGEVISDSATVTMLPSPTP